MLPLRIELEGFLCYRDKTVLDFRGETLWPITGPNAAGKSAIFDAMTYVLYGEHRGGRIHEERLMSHRGDFTRAALDFRAGEHAYRVERTMSRRPSRGRRLLARPTKTWGAWSIDPEECGEGIPIPNTSSQAELEAWVEKTVGLTYRTFTSSVLLQQGNTDRFTLATPGQRKDILLELLDLDVYKKLEERARFHQSKKKDRLDELSVEPGRFQGVSCEALIQVNGERREAKRLLAASRADSERAHLARGNATLFESLSRSLLEIQGRLANAREVLRDEASITGEHEEYCRLESSLPVLEQMVDYRRRAALARAEAESLMGQAGAVDLEELIAAKSQAILAEASAALLLSEARRVAQQARQGAESLRPAAEAGRTLLGLARNREEEGGRLDEYRGRLAAHYQVRARFDECEQAARILPDLNVLAEQRALARTLSEESTTLSEQATGLNEEGGQLKERAGALRAEEKKAREESSRLGLVRAGLLADHARADEELRIRRDASTESTCSRCGQRIEAAQIQMEIADAAARLDDLARHIGELDAAIDELSRSADESGTLAKDAEDRLGILAGSLGRIERRVDLDQQKLDAARELIRSALERLPEPYTSAAAADSYPGPDDLSRTAALASDLGPSRKSKEQLDLLLSRVDLLETQLQGWTLQEEELKSRFPGEDLTAAVPRHQVALVRAADLARAEEDAERTATEVSKAARSACEVAEEASRAKQELLDQADGATRDARELESAASALTSSLAASWPNAASVGEGDLEVLRERLGELSESTGRKVRLEEARRDLREQPQELARLEGEIAAIPEEDRVAVDQAEERMAEAALNVRTWQRRWQEMDNQARSLASRYGERVKLKREEDRVTNLYEDYKYLAKEFGKDGLRSWLVEGAQEAIGYAANDFLARISGSTLRLEMIQTGDELEILVTDFSSGQEPIDVHFMSGSQKFRTSVALALAIGQYSGGGSRRIRSVIVDEGFGSLDTQGRQDMIDQLRELKGVLDRVIFVSHQEELHSAFPNGYHIEKVNGSSRVTLRSDGA